MAHFKLQFLAPILLMMILVVVDAKSPPGIAKNPTNARCLIKKYKHCYNLEHVCPEFCPDQCTVECASCKPICSGNSNPPPSDGNVNDNNQGGDHNKGADHGNNQGGDQGSDNNKGGDHGNNQRGDNNGGGRENDHNTPPATPSPSTPTTPSSETAPATARCRSSKVPQCYNMEHVCPKACPGGCEVDCVACKPVCRCDRPGAVCQDPRFIGGDGITFYFHGKKDKDFCLVSDSNIHINAHFIGRRNENMKRDFTWVQSIAILFDKHQLFIGALKTSTWDDSVDRLALSFDGEPVHLPETEGYKWQSTYISLTRAAETNNILVEVGGKFQITAKVVPITEEDSRIHNYGITKEDCFAHLDLGFKFYSLSDEVNGVLGQTYRPGYVTKVNMGAKMPVMGGSGDFEASSLFAADCVVSRFYGAAFEGEEYMKVLELPSLRCNSGIDGKGGVCKR